MSAQETTWVYPPHDAHLKSEIVEEFNIHPVTAQILISRGHLETSDINEFLYGKLPNLYDPDLFPDMDLAVERILTAIDDDKAILIFGDNDVDGMTAAALLTEFLQDIGARVVFGLPSKQKSLTDDALKLCLDNHCALLITVDCGVSEADAIFELKQQGIDVIVTDHHEPTHKLPHCIATLNPKLIDSTYPDRHLTGVGVAFKLAHAIASALDDVKIDLKRYLDLVALGTIADLGALRGENRILVRYGLRQMRKARRVGLSKLFQISDLSQTDPTPTDISSKIAPRLNSLGRIADPQKGVELLLLRDEKDASLLAQELDLNNIERQKIEREVSLDVESYLLQHPEILEEKAIVLISHTWHPGIIPIIAARLAKQYNRPTLIITIENGVGKGSIRTIPEFPLLPVLHNSAPLLASYGGHDFAAGLSILEENIPAFAFSFLQMAKTLKELDVRPKLHLDAEANFSELTFDFLESLSLLEPFGHDNPPPLLYADVIQTWPPKLVSDLHLKLFLSQNDLSLEGIAFNMKHRLPSLRHKNLPLRIAFTPHINVFQNKASIQLHIKDFIVL